MFLFQLDNRGNRLLVPEESAINTPAVGAAYVIKRYSAQATDEISFEVKYYFFLFLQDFHARFAAVMEESCNFVTIHFLNSPLPPPQKKLVSGHYAPM